MNATALTPQQLAAQHDVHIIDTPTPFIVGPVNSVLIKTEPITLIDTGTLWDEAWDALVARLREHGLEVSDIQRLMLTHHHADHVGLLSRVVEQSGAEVWGHPDLVRQGELTHEHSDIQRQFFTDVMTQFGVDEETAEQSMLLWSVFKQFTSPYSIDHAFEDGGFAGPFRTWFVPGHSATDTLLVDEERGYTIAGDHILEIFNPNPLIRRPEPGEPRPKTLLEFRASLFRSRALELGLCIPGHGAPFDDHRRVIDGILQQHEKRCAKILDWLPASGATPYEVACMLYPDSQMRHLYLALSVAIGQLELLEERGEVEASGSDVLLYSRS